MNSIPLLDQECFFISPIGDAGTEVRKRSDDVLERIVKEAAKRLKLEAVRGDQIRVPGMVTEQVMYHATQARAAVADITDNNPNVIYELGIRAAVPKPVVLIAEKGSAAAPFNIQGLRKIIYDRTDNDSIRRCVDEIVDYVTNSYPTSYLELPTPRLVRSGGTSQSVPSGYEIGCRIGRRNTECGILQVEVGTTGLPTDQGVRIADDVSGVVHKNNPDFRPWSKDKKAFWKKFSQAVADLVEAAADHGIQVNTIGIAVPGGVLPRQGRFGDPVEGTPFDEYGRQPIVSQLARFLQDKIYREKIRDVFGVSDLHELEAKIHLDNDARCAARWVACTHAGDPDWRDYCCLFVGSGVGSGLVLDGNVYYGTHNRAGEVGHVTLNLEDHLHIDDVVLGKRLCSCGRREFHFEALVGVGGLGYLAECISKEDLSATRTWIQKNSPSVSSNVISLPSHSEPEHLGIDRYDESGFVILRALLHQAQHSSELWLRDYLSRIIGTYERIFNIGTGALMDVLDVDRLALCGVIPEVFSKDRDLRDSLSKPRGLIPGRTVADWGHMSEWGWRGAALLSRDSGYMARR